MGKHFRKSYIPLSACLMLAGLLIGQRVNATSLFDAKTQLLRDAETKKIYAVIEGVRHYITNTDILRSYAFRLIALKDVTKETLDKFEPVRLIKSSLGPRVYLLDSATGQKVWYPTEGSFINSGESWNKIVAVSGDDSRATRNGHLAKTANSSDVYYLNFEALTRALISSPAIYTAAGFRSSDVLVVPEPLLTAYRLVDPLTLETVPKPNQPPAPEPRGLLNVSLVPTDLATSIPSGTSRNELTRVVFKAGANDVTITGLVLTRHGFLADRDVTGVMLFDENGFALTRLQTFNEGTVRFSLSKPFVISANHDRQIIVSANFASTLSANGQSAFSLALENAGAITTTSVTATAAFPVTTKTFTVLNANTLIGSLILDTVQISSGPRDVHVGDKNQDLNRLKITAGTGREAVLIDRIVFTAVGNANIDDFENLKLLDSHNKVVAIRTSATGSSVALKFTTPYKILSGQSQEFILRGDIIGGSGNSVQFTIENDYDVYAKGDSFKYAVTARSSSNGGNFPVGSTSLTGQNAIRIIGGDVAVALSIKTPTGSLTKGADSAVLVTIDIRPVGQNLRFDRVAISIATTTPHTPLRGSLSLRPVGGSSIGTVDAASAIDRSAIMNISSTPVLVANKTYTYELVGSISDGVVVTDSYQVSLSDFRFTLSGETQAVTFSRVVTSPVRPTREISLFVRNDPLFTISSIPVGKLRTKIGRLLFKASPGEDIRIDEVVLEPKGDASVSFSRGFSNLKLGGATIASPSGNSYRFPLNLTVGASREYGVDLLVDSSLLSDGTTAQFAIGTITAFGKTSGAKIVPTLGNSETPAVAFKRTTVTVTEDTSFVGGTTIPGNGVAVASFVLTAAGAEDVQIAALTFVETSTSSGLAVTRGYKNMRLIDGENKRLRSQTLGSPASGTGGNRLTSGPTLAPGQRMLIRVVVDTTTAVVGDTIQLLLSTIETIGRDSRITAGVSGLPFTSSAVTFAQ